jgi:hypothetical protein
LVGTLVDSYEESLKKGQLMYEIFVALWVGVVLLGAGFIIWGKCKDILTLRDAGIGERAIVHIVFDGNPDTFS